jgi:hypothetical protein
VHRSDHDGVLPTFFFTSLSIILPAYAISLGDFVVGTVFQFLFFAVFFSVGPIFYKEKLLNTFA